MARARHGLWQQAGVYPDAIIRLRRDFCWPFFFCLFLGLVLQSPFVAMAQEYQKTVSNRLNPTGRTVAMPVPVEYDGSIVGEAQVRIGVDDTVEVATAALSELLRSRLDASALAALAKSSSKNGYSAIDSLRLPGLDIELDRSRLMLVVGIAVDQRAVRDVSLARGDLHHGAARYKPALMSGYVNLIAGVDHLWSSGTGVEATSPRLEIESVFRMWNIVVENDLLLEGEADSFTCPLGARCIYAHEGGLKRQRSRLVYDLPGHGVRVQAGDVDTWGSGFQRIPDLMGLTIEHSPRKLQPGASGRPSGRSSFRLDRASDVDVLVNGTFVQRLRLRAGLFNLSDLPLVTGANDIELVITDDLGQRRTLSFSTFWDAERLAPGQSEWSLSAGVASAFRDGSRIYFDDAYFATGFYRRGITDRLSGEIHAQADEHVAMGGIGAIAASAWGLVGLELAGSVGDQGTGVAARVDWDLVNYRGVLGRITDVRETLRLGAEYRSREFRAPGQLLVGADGILFPQHLYWLKLTGAYSIPIGWGAVASLSARYQFANEESTLAFVNNPYVIKGDRYGADLTVSAPLGSGLSGSLTVGYSNETHLRYFTRAPVASFDDDDAAFRVMARLYWRLGGGTQATFGYDTLTSHSTASVYRHLENGTDRWELQAEAAHLGRDDRALAAGAIGHVSDRWEARVAHSAAFAEGGQGRDGQSTAHQRTSARVGASVAFADGHFGVGRPIRGGGFAVVHPHASLAGKEVRVGRSGVSWASTQGWGTVVVTDLPAYVPVSLPIDVPDLPIGYSLGAGVFEVAAPYKAGYSLQVGSAFTVTAVGTLLDEEGRPAHLLSGFAYSESNPDRRVAIFTNRAGRFAAEGLAPGTWGIELTSDELSLRYSLVIEAATSGIVWVGELRPSGGGKRQ